MYCSPDLDQGLWSYMQSYKEGIGKAKFSYKYVNSKFSRGEMCHISQNLDYSSLPKSVFHCSNTYTFHYDTRGSSQFEFNCLYSLTFSPYFSNPPKLTSPFPQFWNSLYIFQSIFFPFATPSARRFIFIQFCFKICLIFQGLTQKLASFYSMKNNAKRMRRQAMDCKKIFAKDALDKGLLPKIYKNNSLITVEK